MPKHINNDPLPAPMHSKILKLMATAEYRSLIHPAERGFYIYQHAHAKQHQVVLLDLCTKRQLQRAIRADKQGRNQGIRGRPRNLTKEESQCVEQEIELSGRERIFYSTEKFNTLV
jgi:hypothetical protein